MRCRSDMKEIGIDPVAPERRSPDYLAKFVESEIAKWAGPVKAAESCVGLISALDGEQGAALLVT